MYHRRIDPEKRKVVMDTLIKMTEPNDKTLRALASQHGISLGTVRNWRSNLKKTNAVKISPPVLTHTPPPAHTVAVRVDAPKSNKSILRFLAAQTLFIAEQLEILAGE